MKKCTYCGKEYSDGGIGTHIWRTHGDGKNHDSNIGYLKGTRIVWNKGLTKDINDSVKKQADTLSKGLVNGDTKKGFLNKKHSDKSRKIISEKLSRNNKGGRCKWFDVKKPSGDTVKVQGTWEQRFASVLNIIDENWIKPTKSNKKHSFKWFDDDGIEHTYTPDFYSPKLNKYFEVKGYWWGNDKNKMIKVSLNNELNIEIVHKKELLMYEKLLIS
jgi:hypothetical protein